LKIKKKEPEDVLYFIQDGDDLLLPITNGEPRVLMDIIEENAVHFQNVRIHQMHALRERSYIYGRMKPSLSYVSYFLSEAFTTWSKFYTTFEGIALRELLIFVEINEDVKYIKIYGCYNGDRFEYSANLPFD
jgi:hypothetical protein